MPGVRFPRTASGFGREIGLNSALSVHLCRRQPRREAHRLPSRGVSPRLGDFVLKALTELYLRNTKVTPAGIAELQKARPALKIVR